MLFYCCNNINKQCRKINMDSMLKNIHTSSKHSTLQCLSNVLSMFCVVRKSRFIIHSERNLCHFGKLNILYFMTLINDILNNRFSQIMSIGSVGKTAYTSLIRTQLMLICRVLPLESAINVPVKSKLFAICQQIDSKFIQIL